MSNVQLRSWMFDVSLFDIPPGYLKDDPSLEIITIKGVGYRFVV